MVVDKYGRYIPNEQESSTLNYKEDEDGSFNLGNSNGTGPKPISVFGNKGGIGSYLNAAQGAMQIGSEMANSLDYSGIGNEVKGVRDISRYDTLNTNVHVDSNQKDVLGAFGSGAMTGASAGMALGPWGAAIGGVAGALGEGLSAVFGNEQKERIAQQKEQQWKNNIQAKSRQFDFNDMRNMTANLSGYGGELFAYGGQMPNALTEFNEGGSHEQNPNGGIQQGIGQNGKPNLVEQGETKHEDYIFSNRIQVTPEITRAYNLPKQLIGKTFADASKYLNKEAKERPNDPISKNATKAQLSKLTMAQEQVKKQQKIDQQDNEKINQLGLGATIEAMGGKINIKPNPDVLVGKKYYADGGVLEGIHDVDDISHEELIELKRLGYDVNLED